MEVCKAELPMGARGVISVVCFFWKPPKGYRSQFNAYHVNVLAAMVARNYQKPHRMICVTDSPDGISKNIEIVPLWKDHADVGNPFGPRNPSCYRRLKIFSRQAGEMFGDRFVTLDLDCVITGDLSPLWDRDEDFVIWGDTAKRTPYNGSMILLNAGARPHVWETFDPKLSPLKTRQAGFFGSDQAWLGLCLGPNEKKWTTEDGVYSYRNQIAPNGGRLPAGARIVMFHGQNDPFSPAPQQLQWVQKHYAMGPLHA